MDLKGRINKHFTDSAHLKLQAMELLADPLARASERMAQCLMNEGKILSCGNGGSAADAQHFAAEFVSQLTKDFRRPGLPAIALTTDTSVLTAYANDFGFDGVFERQVRALGRSGDVLVAMSTSGNSQNVRLAVRAARQMGLRTIGLLGRGGHLSEEVDCPVVIPTTNTQHVQESLLPIEHAICDLVERQLYGTDAC